MRLARGWGQKEVARALGVPTRVVSAWHRGKPIPTRADLLRCAAAMGYPEGFVDQAITFLRTERVTGPANAAKALAEIHRLAAEQGAVYRETLVRTLTASHFDGLAIFERGIAEELWCRLRPMSAAERRFQVEEDEIYHRWGLALRLAQESISLAADDESSSLVMAELARTAAEKVDGDEGFRARLQGFIGAFVANALRVGGKLPQAAREMARARVLFDAGFGSDHGLLDESRFLSLEASLLRDQRRIPDALARLEAAIRLAPPISIPLLLVKKARTLEEIDDYEGAVATLREALPCIDMELDPRGAWAARFNLCENLLELERPEEAAPLLAEIRELALRLGNGLDLLRLRWLDGRCAALRGDWAGATEALTAVRDEFVARGIPFDAALASQELNVALLEQGKTAEVKQGARLLVHLFQALEVDREVLASLSLFCAAAQEEEASLEQARHLVRLLRRERRAAHHRDRRIVE
jgi:transcriptional regulator with XRE-family HTH domain